MTGQPKDQYELMDDLSVAAVNLLVNVGIMNAVSDAWPREVRDNWIDRLATLESWMTGQMGEVQEFASSYDN